MSRASALMLQHRPDVVEKLRHVERDGRAGHVIVRFRRENAWCSDDWTFPENYMERICAWPDVVGQIGVYVQPLIVCPDFYMSVCIHEIAHAVHYALPDGELVRFGIGSTHRT